MTRGYFSIGVYHPKTHENIGTLFRSALAFGASSIYTIGPRYKPQASDTPKSWKHIPLVCFTSFEDFFNLLPRESLLVGIEITEKSIPLSSFSHPERAHYLLGAEDHGLPSHVLDRCHTLVQIPMTAAIPCLNVAVSGSVVMWDRFRSQSCGR